MKSLKYVFLLVGLCMLTPWALGNFRSPYYRWRDGGVRRNDDATLSPFSVTWKTPSGTPYGSMPLGNGDIGINTWVDKEGDLLFYISKADAWDNSCRLLKLGRVRVSLSPSPFKSSTKFEQKLDIKKGIITIKGKLGNLKTEMRFMIDANNPIIDLDIKSSQPTKAKVSLELWRKSRPCIKAFEVFSGSPTYQVREEADTVVAEEKGILWYHRNKTSSWKDSLTLQGLEALTKTQKDPLLNLTFGALIKGTNLVNSSPKILTSSKASKEIRISTTCLTAQTKTANAWIEQLKSQTKKIAGFTQTMRMKAHTAWWTSFWKRSDIQVSTTKTEKEAISVKTMQRGYNLQRFINACSGRAQHPIKFNGTIFNVDGVEKRRPCNADYRRWNGPFWFQNTRLIYWNMLMTGDFDLMMPLFNMYKNALETRKYATKKYYNHDGAFFPETMFFWGCYTARCYGTKEQRGGRPHGWVKNSYVRYYWQGGLELSLMMLDYYSFTKDPDFVKKYLLPITSEIMTFYDQHWKRGKNGKILFDPAASLETWHSAVNPLAEIVGIAKVGNELLKLPKTLTTEKQRAQWKRTISDLPKIPTGTYKGKRVLLPAHTWVKRKRNTENPELYAIFPYRRYMVTKPDLEIAKNTFARRGFKGTGGWSQDAIKAAYLGRTAEAAKYVKVNLTSWNRGMRFPTNWGPNADWTPDQDHGSVALIALQRMLLQYDNGKLILFPAWPKHWDVKFKLHAPQKTIIKGEFKDGKIIKLKVTPKSREKDIINLLK